MNIINTIFDISIYILFAFFSSWLARKSEGNVEYHEISPYKWDKYLIYFIIFFTIIGGLRYNVGADSLSYCSWFTQPPHKIPDKEHFWWWLLETYHSLGLHWVWGMILCAFIQIFFIVKALKPYRYLLVFVPFLFFGGRYWLDCMNAVRQMIVACAFVWAANFIKDRKIIYYAIFIALATEIHQSAILLSIFYFLPLNRSFTNQRIVLLSIFITCFILGLTPSFTGLSGYIDILTENTNYDDYSEFLIQRLQSSKSEEALAFGPMMLTYLLIPIFIIWYGPKLQEYYEDEIPQFNLWFNLAFLYACLYFLVCNISHLFIRPVMYLSLFQMIMGAMLLKFLWDQTQINKHFITSLIIFSIVLATNTTWDVIKAQGIKEESTTYKIIFFHKKDLLEWNLPLK